MFNEYEKLRMRQNPMLQPRGPAAGGRSMPAWFSASLVTQSRMGAPSPPPPPLPAEPPPVESDYEEIDHLPKNPSKKPGSRRACSLCGNPNPAVSCEMCNNQIFCGSCNDMYHRHPKRQHHSRKILEPLLENRPPLPPKTPIPNELLQAQLPPLPPSHPPYASQTPGVPTPQPPPRRKGRFGMRSAAGSPTPGGSGIKSFFDPVGTLKKFMGGMAHRPLPPPPKPPPPLPPKPAELGRSMTPTFRGPMIGERRLNSPQPGQYPHDERHQMMMPRTAMEMQNARMHSMSVANLSGHTSSRDSGYPDWEEDEETDFFSRNRAQSVSGGVLGRFPSTSQDASHFATLHRPGRNQQRQPATQSSTTSLSSPLQSSGSGSEAPPERPPPPLPPRQFPSQTQLSFQSSQSAFDLDRMAAVAQQQNAAAFGMPPWNYPMAAYPFEFQQAMMMGYPGGGTMHRTPSTQSMGPSMNPSQAQQPQFFGWGPMGFGPPMSQMEMDMLMNRRGSEQFMNMLPQQQGPSGGPRGVPLSNPVTPQGSFRKKQGRHMSVEPEFTRRLENRSALDFAHNRRSGTPSSFVRVPPSSSASSTPAPSASAFATTPKPAKPPARPPNAGTNSQSDQSPDDSYFSAERQQFTESSESTPEFTENPEGPWECEHCTFINPKSTKVCTICCKTPSAGYKAVKGKRSVGGKARLNKKQAEMKAAAAAAASSGSTGVKRRDSSKESNASSVVTTGSEEVVPVLKSKLSISRDQKEQKTKINLVSKVEKEKVKKSAMKAGSSGTLKAGTAPPSALKALPVGAKKKLVKKGKSKVVAHEEEETEDDEDEELIAEPEEDEEPEEEIEEDENGSEEDEEDDREEKSEDDNADDEDGVVNVKISSGKMGAVQRGRGKGAATKLVDSGKKVATSGGKLKQGGTARQRASSITRATRLVDSNEDVYGSVPIQTLAISPKIDIKRSTKSKVSTGVGTSSPSTNSPTVEATASATSPIPPEATTQDTQPTEIPQAPKEEPIEVPKSPEVTPKPTTKTVKKVKKKKSDKDTQQTSTSTATTTTTTDNTRDHESPEVSTVTVTTTATVVASSSPPPPSTETKSVGKTKKPRKLSVSTGTQATSTDVSTSASTVASATESESLSSSSFHTGKDSMKEEDKVELPEAKPEVKTSTKSSVGTSPPPQSISTQTYEDASPTESGTGMDSSILLGAPPTKSSSKSSLNKSDNEQYYDAAPRHNIEMSEKALMRYARKARNKEQHYQKLKRSLSTQLNYPGAEAWMESAEGRHLYRSSSRQSLISDTRSLPYSGPPSRDSSPPPGMGRYSGSSAGRGSSRGGGSDWYEEFRRYPPSSSMWDSRYGMPPESFFESIDNLLGSRRQGGGAGGRRESIRSQEFELTRMLKDAEEYNFSPEDVQVGIRMCGEKNPIKWLQENWASMIDTVQTLATKYGHEKGVENNDVGNVTAMEARDAIRANRGNVWAAVTECVDQRRRKFHKLESRGTFLREDILQALTTHKGNLEAAYVELSKQQLKPFLMRIWGGQEESEENKPEASGHSERSNSLPGPPETATGTVKVKKTRKSSLSVASSKKGAGAGAAPPKQLETLVSSAEKVTQEIEKAIQELKKSGAVIQAKEEEEEEPEPEQHEELQVAPVSEPQENEPEPEDEPEVAVVEAVLHLKSEPESELAQLAKSDEGEDESFVDAMSAMASMANSPPQIGSPVNELVDVDDYPEPPEESGEINNNTIDRVDDVLANEENYDNDQEFDEDVLEIEIDDHEEQEEEEERNDNEFIENYGVIPASEQEQQSQEEEEEEEEDGERVEEEMEEDDQTGNATKQEIEKLMTVLTSTFSEMEQFAYKIKENIATEIQQQLAAATKESKKARKGSHDHSEDGSYEPIELPPGIEENVNKKVAKYQRLAAKKKEKAARNKSPESIPLDQEKEPSLSPLPSTSSSKKKLKKIKEQVKQEKEVARQEEKKAEEVEHQKENEEMAQVEIEETEVEIEVQNEEEDAPPVQEFQQVQVEDEGESVGEESEEEIILEEDAEQEEQEEEEEDDDRGDIYANVEISTEGVSITPSDTDKVIVAASQANLKTVKKMAASEQEKDVVIVAEDLSKTEIEETKEKEEVAEVKVEETPAQRLISEAKVDNLEQAELALQLLEMNFSEDDAYSAAKECSSLSSALSYLQQECDLCTGKFSAREMVSMIHCTHLCCRNCARDYFTVQVRDKTIVDATCPFCAEPTTLADDSEQATEYFNHLDILLKNLLDSKHHEMFQRKLRDWTLAKTPNFKWCSKCSSGFITEPLQTRLVCPDCKAVTCAICMETWDKVNHDHREDSASSAVKLCDTAPKSIIEYLNANHIECPRCHFRFSLARGGCMHLTCTQCHHEFCSGCAAPFRMGDKCEAKYPICDKLGLHAHHPRNCLFYLRDKEPDQLAKLLEENAIPYFKENTGEEKVIEVEDKKPEESDANGAEVVADQAENAEANKSSEESSAESNADKPVVKMVQRRVCQVPIQRETSDGYQDDICGKEAPKGYATVCKTHYIEYLGLLIWQNHLDPITILTNDDLEVIVRRAFKKHPGRPNWLSDELFRKRLLKVINDEIPL